MKTVEVEGSIWPILSSSALTAIETITYWNHGPSFEMPAPVHSASCTHWQPKIHSSKARQNSI